MIKNNFSISLITSDILDNILNIERNSYKFPWTKENVISEIENPDSFNRCIKYLEKDIVGYIFSYVTCNEMYIENFCIAPDFRNQKLGTFFLQEILYEAKQKQIKTIFLDVRAKNTFAIILYQKFNFVNDCTRCAFYSDGESAILMHLDI
jgi:[ribosomal protein S18]-alanine N-acetyltransferase